MNTRIGFSTPRHFNPISWVVRHFTKSACSHTFFIYKDQDWGEDFVMEAHEMGFRLIPLTRFEVKNDIVASFKVDIDVGLKFIALEYLGTAYNFGKLLGTSLVLLGRWLKRRWHNPLHSAQALICSESVVIALQKSRYPGAEKMVARDTTPQDLLTFFTAGAPHAD